MKQTLPHLLDDLLYDPHPPCVTLCFGAGPEAVVSREPRNRLKALARHAERFLVERGYRAAEVRELFAPVAQLALDPVFWREPSPSCVLFLGPGVTRRIDLNERHPDFWHVGERFVLLPLLLDDAAQGSFYLLALSQRRVTLYRGDPYGLWPIDVEGLPTTADEALHYDEFEKQMQFHFAVGKLRHGKNLPIYHGMGAGEDGKKTLRERFVQIVSGVVDSYLVARHSNRQPPLLLAGVDYLCALYRTASRYRNILPGNIPGNPDRLSGRELHALSLARLEAAREGERARERERLEVLRARGRLVTDLSSIATRLAEGTLEELLLVRDTTRDVLARSDSAAIEAANELVARALRACVPVTVIPRCGVPKAGPAVGVARRA